MSETILFEDSRASGLGSLVLTRPVFELVAGARSQRVRIETLSGRPVRAVLTRPALAPWCRLAGLDDFRTKTPAPPWLFVNGRALPDRALWGRMKGLVPGEALLSAGEDLLAFCLEGDPREAQRFAEEWVPAAGAVSRGAGPREGPDHAGAGRVERSDQAGGIALGLPGGAMGLSAALAPGCRVLTNSWDLVTGLEQLLPEDLSALCSGERPLSRLADAPQAGLFVRGDQAFVEAEVRLSPPVVIDSTAGPVFLGRGSEVGPFAQVEGPAFLAAGARVLGGRVAQTYVGPGCRIRGEIATSLFMGWTNKAHDGFVGHSVFGEWVNLGAMTTTSNLKNTYGEIRMGRGRQTPTGRQKLGSLVGDHTRTSIGTLLAGGTSIGVGVNLFGAPGMAPHWLPSFLWGVGSTARTYELERFLQVVERVLARRERTLLPEEREILAAAHAATAAERDAYLSGIA